MLSVGEQRDLDSEEDSLIGPVDDDQASKDDFGLVVDGRVEANHADLGVSPASRRAEACQQAHDQAKIVAADMDRMTPVDIVTAT